MTSKTKLNQVSKYFYKKIWHDYRITISPNDNHTYNGWKFKSKHQNEIFEHNMEKFAESIIHECTILLRTHDMNESADKLINHFFKNN